MKKVMMFALAGLAVLAFSVAPVVACDGHKDGSKASAQLTSDKAACGSKSDASKASAQLTSDKAACGSKTDGANATMIGANGSCASKTNATSASATGEKGTCNYAGQKLTADECAKLMASMSPEECAKLCGYDGKMQMVNMNIKGMTCGGCEGSVTAALEKVDGVVKVLSVNHKDGSALVCIDPAKTKAETLTQTVTNKGYEAQVIPAVATTGTASTKAAGCSKVCTPEEMAACASKGAAKTGAEGTK